MGFMFCDNGSFDWDISRWKVSNVVNMTGMFYNAISFRRDISGWDVSSVNKWQEIFEGCAIPVENTPVKFRTVPLN
jgi:surface protein